MYKTLHLDSEEVNIYFTSDPHFGHDKIIEYCDRPFKDSYEMNQVLTDNWNNKITDDDLVFVLGDFSMKIGSKAIRHIFHHLNGQKYLIIGNHDREWKLPWIDESLIKNLLIKDSEMEEGEQRITLCHYPMLSWYQSHRGAWQLFGHVHGSEMPITKTQLDVGVDVHNFTPISYDEVKTIITKKGLGK